MGVLNGRYDALAERALPIPTAIGLWPKIWKNVHHPDA
jgi:hypothetical protein